MPGYHEWGRKMQDDVTDATLWAIEQKIADKDNICIYGASYGGYAALMGAVREPTLYQCAASYAGVSDLQLMFKTGDIRYSNTGRTYLHESLGDDEADLPRALTCQSRRGYPGTCADHPRQRGLARRLRTRDTHA